MFNIAGKSLIWGGTESRISDVGYPNLGCVKLCPKCQYLIQACVPNTHDDKKAYLHLPWNVFSFDIEYTKLLGVKSFA